MDKMRWFIIGNLIGFAVLLGGVALNNSFRHNEASPARTESETPKDALAVPASEPKVEEGLDTTSRLVTTRDISKGTILQAGDVELHSVQLKRAKAEGFTDVETALGCKTKVDLVEGEILQPFDLEKK